MARHGVTLECRATLYFEAETFVPALGEFTPCVRHGYCSVTATGPHWPDDPVGARSRARPRTRDQLVAYLKVNSPATLTELRRKRFTLRLVEDARLAGCVVVDAYGSDACVRTAREGRCASPTRARSVLRSSPESEPAVGPRLPRARKR